MIAGLVKSNMELLVYLVHGDALKSPDLLEKGLIL